MIKIIIGIFIGQLIGMTLTCLVAVNKSQNKNEKLE